MKTKSSICESKKDRENTAILFISLLYECKHQKLTHALKTLVER